MKMKTKTIMTKKWNLIKLKNRKTKMLICLNKKKKAKKKQVNRHLGLKSHKKKKSEQRKRKCGRPKVQTHNQSMTLNVYW